MDFNLIISRSISLHHCPECKSTGSLDRVRISSLWDNILLKIFQLRSYHCRKCKWSGKVFLYKIRNNPWKIIGNYGILVLILFVFLILVNLYFRK